MAGGLGEEEEGPHEYVFGSRMAWEEEREGARGMGRGVGSEGAGGKERDTKRVARKKALAQLAYTPLRHTKTRTTDRRTGALVTTYHTSPVAPVDRPNLGRFEQGLSEIKKTSALPWQLSAPRPRTAPSQGGGGGGGGGGDGGSGGGVGSGGGRFAIGSCQAGDRMTAGSSPLWI